MGGHQPDDFAFGVFDWEHGDAVERGGKVGDIAVDLADQRLSRAEGRFLAVDVDMPEMARVEVLRPSADYSGVIRQVHELERPVVLEVDVALDVLDGDA